MLRARQPYKHAAWWSKNHKCSIENQPKGYVKKDFKSALARQIMKLATFDNVEGNCPVSFVAKSYGDTALVTSEKINGIQIATA